MNAMEAARSANWRDSLSFNPSLRMSFNPDHAIIFNSKLAAETGFFEEVAKDPAAVLARHGLGHLAEHVPARLDDVMVLSPEQRNELKEIFCGAATLSEKDREAMVAMLEGNLKGSSHAQPMLAVVVIAIAVAIFIYVLMN